MGYNNEYAEPAPVVVFDIETVGLDDAEQYLDPVLPAANLKDPAKIAADIEARTAARLERLALDWNVGRVAALGWWTEDTGLRVERCETEGVERMVLALFWQTVKASRLVGYRIREFDLPFLLQRSLYLEVDAPRYELGRYARGSTITDLYDRLTFNDLRRGESLGMRQTLGAFCRRLGIPAPEMKGADVPALVAAGRWDQVEAHCLEDVRATVALARRLGEIR
jgi:hypothetical protein